MFAPVPLQVRVALVSGLLLAVGAGCSSGATDSAPHGSSATSGPSDPTPGATATQDPGEQVTAALAALDRRERVAQLFVVGVQLDDLSGGDDLAGSGVGGIFLAGRSHDAAADLAQVTAGWQSRAPGPGLWMAVDQEGGKVQSLRGSGFEPLPSATAQASLPPAELTALADRMGAALHSAGINVDLAPVADVVPAGTEAGNEPIGAFDRQYGSTAATVVAAAGAVVEGLAAHGVTATLKHFPGLGRVRGNTDTRAEVTDDVTTAEDDQVRAFGALLHSPSRPFVMMSSAVYTRIDPTGQAAFSPVVVSGLLRERLGFDGVVISDDLANARAVHDLPPGERATRFLAAGGTLVLTLDDAILPAMIDAVVERADADPAFAAAVDDAVRITLLAKARAGLLTG
jgi:beta-glucosidase-like glycosyl hydrolase